MKKRKVVASLLVWILLGNCFSSFSLFAEEKKKVTIAVYELTAKEVNVGMVSVLSDVLRDAIFQTGRFEMLTKEDMQRVLENMAEKQQVKPDCDSDACIAEIAGALGVELMVTGSVGKVGKTYVINLRLVDTELVSTKNTKSLSCPCEEDILIEKVKQAGLELLKVVGAPEKKEEPPPVKEAAKPVKEEFKAPIAPPPQEKAVVTAPPPVESVEEVAAEGEKSHAWIWWTLGIVLVGGGAAAAAGGGAKSSGGGGGGGGGDGGSNTGNVTVRW